MTNDIPFRWVRPDVTYTGEMVLQYHVLPGRFAFGKWYDERWVPVPVEVVSLEEFKEIKK